MHPGLRPLLLALDRAPAPVTFFLRDDDAGWADDPLRALLDTTAQAAVPIDLAAIPQAVSLDLARALNDRMLTRPELLGVHQHGWTHANHEAAGRKCEFGASRPAAQQQQDLSAGRDRMRVLFGERVDPIFTPPWNRCSAETPALLARLGFAALSRSRGAPAQSALPEWPVDVDWSRQRRLGQAAGDDGCAGIATALAARVEAGGPVGLMLHHADMTPADLDLLAQLLHHTRQHAQARWRPMRELLAWPLGDATAAHPQDARELS